MLDCCKVIVRSPRILEYYWTGFQETMKTVDEPTSSAYGIKMHVQQ